MYYIFQRVFQNFNSTTDTDLNTYCRNNCSGLLYDLFVAMKKDCGAGPVST